MKNLCYFLAGAVISLVACTIYTGLTINKYDAYYVAAEHVLDMVYDEYDSFYDTIGETDTYCDYIDARDRIAQ